MPSEKAIARQAKYDAAKAERLANPVPKIERHWVQIKEVPEHVQSDDAKLAIQYLLAKTDKIEMMQFPKDQSQYKAYLDDGVSKGYFVFTWTENGLTPLKVYEKLEGAGWPGYKMDWVKDAAKQEMLRELTKQNTIGDTDMRDFLPYPDRRHMRAQRLTAEILQEISPFLQGEQRRDIVRAIETLLWRKGVEVLTDFDRESLGLPERGNDGWTQEELRILELKRQEMMLNPNQPFLVKPDQINT